MERLFESDLNICFWPDFLPADQCQSVFEQLKQEVVWEQGQIRLFGKILNEPRMSAWYGDAAYTYSGKTMSPRPWTPLLQDLRKQVATHCLVPFNAVLLNLYRNGQDSMGLHSDDEPELGPEPVIASLSLGASRGFILRHKQQPRRHRLELTNGSLLVMAGPTQSHWKHELPKDKSLKEARINLTFRLIQTEPEKLQPDLPFGSGSCP